MTVFRIPYNLSGNLTKSQGRWLFYVFLGIVTNSAMWGLALLYLKVTPPIYKSNWALTLPGTASSTSVNLPEVGTASSQAVSPYAIQSQDPRENYKFILTSQPVQKAAATQINVSPEEFGEPRIKIIDNTSLISIELSANSPEEAQKKSWALYKAFKARLNELRAQESAQREAGVQVVLSEAYKKLEISRKRLSHYQVQSGLSSNTQIEQLSVQIEDLRRKRAEILAQQQQSSTRISQLSKNLNLTVSQAKDILTLKADQLFQQHLKDYIDANAKLNALISKYLPEHPTVVQQRGLRDSAKIALLTRGESLLGRPLDGSAMAQLNVGGSNLSGSERESFLQTLITAQVGQRELEAQARELDRQIALLEVRLKTMSQYWSNLEALRRDLQISETVFSSTAASLDLGKSNIFGSYPEVQLLTEPSLPKSPSSPKKKLVVLGAGVCSLLWTSGLVLLGWRARRIQLSK